MGFEFHPEIGTNSDLLIGLILAVLSHRSFSCLAALGGVSTTQRHGGLGLRVHFCVDFSTADEVAWADQKNSAVADPASPNARIGVSVDDVSTTTLSNSCPFQ